MSRTIFALSLSLAMAAFAVADDSDYSVGEQGLALDGCDACCCASNGGFFGEFEATFFRYHRGNGMRTQYLGPDAGDDASLRDSEFNFAPRITVGWADCNGLGVRVRYWDYDLDETAAGGAGDGTLSVDTYNIDLELFRRVEVTCDFTLEMSAGIRYNEFQEIISEDGAGQPEFDTTFDGLGILLGIEARQCFCSGEFYAGGRFALLTGDQLVFDDGDNGVYEARPDVILGVIELRLGYEVTYCNWYARAGVEWQQWAGYSEHMNNNDNPIGSSDVGFAGFAVAGGYMY